MLENLNIIRQSAGNKKILRYPDPQRLHAIIKYKFILYLTRDSPILDVNVRVIYII